MVIKLKNSYPCIHGLPVIHSVDTEIFQIKYFMHCMQCTFCNDQCCSYGADIDMLNVNRILDKADELEKYIGIKREKWFYPKKRKWDHEYPGHDYTRTTKRKNACIFLNRKGRGCLLHSFGAEKGYDYHEFKPFFCTIFPVTYFEGILVIPEEIDEKLTACLGPGPTLYQGARNELRYFFGDGLIRELDEIESGFTNPGKKSA
jgi:Fe-S-cluster containining protein